jgi:hypothetical protein
MRESYRFSVDHRASSFELSSARCARRAMSILCVCLIHGARRRKSIRPTKLIPNAPQKKKNQSSDMAHPYFVNSARRTDRGTRKGDGSFPLREEVTTEVTTEGRGGEGLRLVGAPRFKLGTPCTPCK